MIVSISLGKAFDCSMFTVLEGEQVCSRDRGNWNTDSHSEPGNSVSTGILGTEVLNNSLGYCLNSSFCVFFFFLIRWFWDFFFEC